MTGTGLVLLLLNGVICGFFTASTIIEVIVRGAYRMSLFVAVINLGAAVFGVMAMWP